jgi:hypothetical protein
VVHVLEPVVHVLELEHIFRTSTRKVHTEREQEVLVKILEHFLRTVTRRVHTMRELEVLVQMLERLWVSHI